MRSGFKSKDESNCVICAEKVNAGINEKDEETDWQDRGTERESNHENPPRPFRPLEWRAGKCWYTCILVRQFRSMRFAAAYIVCHSNVVSRAVV